MYREWTTTLPGAIAWVSRSTSSVTVVPDGCMDLIWTGSEYLVAGPDTRAHLVAASHHLVVGLRLSPGLMPSVLRVPANVLTDQRIPLREFVSAREGGALLREADAGHAGRTMLDLARDRLANNPPPGWVAPVVGGLAASATVAAVAARAGWSERQLRRHALSVFGYGPKRLARHLRLQRALAAGRGGAASYDADDVAVAAGYTDQSHLGRETRALTGRTFAALREERRRQSGASDPAAQEDQRGA